MLLSGKYPNPSDKVKQLSTSFGSDLVYAVSCGKIKPLKQILLPFAVKSLTGMIHALNGLGHSVSYSNGLGHSVSYSQLGEIDTSLCLQKLTLSVGNIALPSNIQNIIFSILAWDNIDRLEETISGKGTPNRVPNSLDLSKLSYSFNN